MDDSGDGARDRGKLSAAISNAIVGIHREYFGRGAKRTRTVMGADYIICFLEDIYTPVERTLIDAGRFPAVQATRSAFQDTMRDNFVEAVESEFYSDLDRLYRHRISAWVARQRRELGSDEDETEHQARNS